METGEIQQTGISILLLKKKFILAMDHLFLVRLFNYKSQLLLFQMMIVALKNKNQKRIFNLINLNMY